MILHKWPYMAFRSPPLPDMAFHGLTWSSTIHLQLIRVPIFSITSSVFISLSLKLFCIRYILCAMLYAKQRYMLTISVYVYIGSFWPSFWSRETQQIYREVKIFFIFCEVKYKQDQNSNRWNRLSQRRGEQMNLWVDKCICRKERSPSRP